MKTAELLGYLSLFDGCSKRQLRSLGEVGAVFRVGIDDPVVEEGAAPDAFWVLAEGLAHVTDRRGVKLASITPGGGFGELALLDGGRRNATVTTVLPGRVVAFEADAFRDHVLRTPAVADRVLAEAQRRRAMIGA